MKRGASAICCSLAVLPLACAGSVKQAPAVVSEPPPTVKTPPAASVAPDPLGPAPAVSLPPPFQPPAPVTWVAPTGLTVWLVERHSLPIVALTVVVPSGSASDPPGEPGLADQAAEMLTEGGGARGSVDFARAVDELGAELDVGVSLDASHAHLEVLKRGLGAGIQLLGDAVVRPRWDAGEWKRLHELWRNDLEERASDPEHAANVVAARVFYGPDHPYAHPIDGLLASAPRVQLADAKRFWSQAWRPDRATLVVVGDVTKGEIEPLVASAFGAWATPKTPPPPLLTPPPPVADEKVRVIVVDRPDAPQAVVRVILPGLAASDPRYPALARANIALGGSFTSRLNADLREARGWTYGAASWVTAPRGVGTVAAGGAFVPEKTGDAVKALLADMDAFAQTGLTEDEAAKTRLQARSETVEEYETVDRASLALARYAGLGLGPEYAATSSLVADRATRGELSELAAAVFGKKRTTIVIVGPRAKLDAPLAAAGFTSVEYRDAEGALVSPPPSAGKRERRSLDRHAGAREGAHGLD